MKKLTIIAGLLLGSASIFAQSPSLKFSLRGSLAIPTGDWSLLQNTGGVLELQANKSLSDRFSLYGSLGYGGFAGPKDIGVSGSSILPILAGFNIDSNVFHAGLGFGYTSIMVGGGSSVGGFTFRPEVGFNLSKKVQLNLNYTSANTPDFYMNYVGITPSFKF